MTCGVSTGVSKYRYWISIVPGVWMELFLNKEAEITYERPDKRIYYRAKSSDWKVQQYLNSTSYNMIVAYLTDFYNCPEIKLKITNDVGIYWLGRTAVNLIEHKLDVGILIIKTTPDDVYNWVDDHGDETPYINSAALDRVSVTIGQVATGQLNVTGTKLINNNFTFGSRSLLTVFLSEFSDIDTVDADFFISAVNPVLGGTNYWNNIRVQGYGSILGTAALGGNYDLSFDKLMDFLFDRFNVYYYIEGTTMYLKHYSEFTFAVLADLTNTVTYPYKYQTIYDRTEYHNETDNEFTYDNDLLPKRENFKANELDGSTFPEKEFYIDYSQYNTVTKNSADDFGNKDFIIDTDNFAERVHNGDSVPSKGMIVMALDGGNLIQSAALWGGGTVSNGYMYYRNLFYYFWRWDRPFENMPYVELTTGTVGTLTATTLRHIKQQRKVRYPLVGVFDPDGLVRTNLGDGEHKSVTHYLDVDFLETTLMYRA